MLEYVKYFVTRYIFLYFFIALVSFIGSFMFIHVPLMCLTLFGCIYYLNKKHKLNQHYLYFQCFMFFFIFIIFTLSMIISNGYLSDSIWNIYFTILFPLFPFLLITSLWGLYATSIFFPVIFMFIHVLFIYYLLKPKMSLRPISIGLLCICIISSLNVYMYSNSPARKYNGGHNFDYMNGYSSTDLFDFYPYNKDNKLVKLQEPSTFTIENEKDMPILDGAEACYPVYSAIAKAVYKNIDKIENKYANNEDYKFTNGKIVSFTNSSEGYTRLINGDIDMFFGAKPSKSQIEEAKEAGVEFEYTPIGKEGFVFFVHENNPVSHLSTQQIKDIYHGSLTNWKEVGGKNQEILAFQRPERSGSQSMMTHFMGETTLKEPLTYEMISGMTGIIQETAQYGGEQEAIGYTFRYFLEGLHQEEHVKILSIDGIYPTTANIKNQSYPLSTYLYCVTLKSNKKENVQKLKDYLLSPQGQYIIEQTGYCALAN